MGNRGPVMDRLRLPWGLSRPNPIHQELLGAKVSANKAGCFLPGLPHCIPRCQLCFSFSQLGFPESWRAAQSRPGTNHPSCWSRLPPQHATLSTPSRGCWGLASLAPLGTQGTEKPDCCEMCALDENWFPFPSTLLYVATVPGGLMGFSSCPQVPPGAPMVNFPGLWRMCFLATSLPT